MLHKQDSSHLTNIPASPASLHYTVYSGFPQKCSPNFLAPSTNKQNLFLLLFEKWSINLIKTKTSVYSFGGKYLFQKILFFFFFFQKENPYQCLLILTQSEAGWFRSILPGGQFLPLGFLSDTRNWELLSSFEGSSATLRHDLFQMSWWLIGPCCFPSHANGSFNSTVK